MNLDVKRFEHFSNKNGFLNIFDNKKPAHGGNSFC
jgi:hypothetical protein